MLRAAEAAVDEIVVFVSASESHNRKNVNCEIEASLAGIEDVARVADESGIPVHGANSVAFGLPLRRQTCRLCGSARLRAGSASLGFAGASLGDTTGMATPPLVAAAVAAVREAAPGLGPGLHFHNTRGIGLANVMAGIELSVDRYESSFGGIGGCPFAPKATGNICTEDLVYLLEEMGIDAGIDLCTLSGIACDVEAAVGHELPGQIMKAGLRLDLHPMDSVRVAGGVRAGRPQHTGVGPSFSRRLRSSRSSMLSCSGSRGRRPAARPGGSVARIFAHRSRLRRRTSRWNSS